MAQDAQRRISHRRAAELLYRTAKPTPGQIERVCEYIAMGELVGDTRGTTADAVADFVSRTALHKQDAAERDPRRQRPQRNSEEAREVYQETLKQYFLAVFLRRKMHNVSKVFRRAVLVGQVVVLCLIAIVFVTTVRIAFPPMSPERVATLDWLEANTAKFRVIEFHPTTFDEDGSAQLWVEYHYTTPQGRGIDTRRMFTVAGGQVISVDSED